MPTQITEVELTAGPAPWAKTIKSKVEIGHSLVVIDNSRTYVRDCKFPLLTTPCPQRHRAKLWGCLTCLHPIFIHVGDTWRKVMVLNCELVQMNELKAALTVFPVFRTFWMTVVLSFMTCGLLCGKSKPVQYQLITVPNKVMCLLWLFMVCLDIIHYSLRAYSGQTEAGRREWEKKR